MRFLLPILLHCCFQQNNPLAIHFASMVKSELSLHSAFFLLFVGELPDCQLGSLPGGWEDFVPGGWLLLPGEGPVLVLALVPSMYIDHS